MNFPSYPTNRQQGSALIVSLSILLVLTVLGVSAMRTTSLEEKMAGNARDSQTAFEAAEAALRNAENIIRLMPANLPLFVVGGPAGYHTPKGNAIEAWRVEGNWANAQVFPAYDVGVGQLAQAPQFMAQMVTSKFGAKTPEAGGAYGKSTPTKPTVIQITARGFGISPNSRAMVQTYFGK